MLVALDFREVNVDHCKSVIKVRSLKSVQESEMTAVMVLPVPTQRKIASLSSLREPATGGEYKIL